MYNEIYKYVIFFYLNHDYRKSSINYYTFLSGTINYYSHKIGYLYIPTFSDGNYLKEFIKQAASDFKSVDAVIIDIRFNGGGNTENFIYALNLFSTERKLYMKSKFRNGPNHSDFTCLYDHYTLPSEDGCKNKPIAILANSTTASSSEHFIMGLKSQDNVILVGDTTCGAFSQVHDRILPNGWIYRIGSQVVYSTEGKLLTNSKGQYLEGNGIAPDYFVADSYAQIQENNDLPLNKALYEISKFLVK